MGQLRSISGSGGSEWIDTSGIGKLTTQCTKDGVPMNRSGSGVRELFGRIFADEGVPPGGLFQVTALASTEPPQEIP